MRVAWGSGLSCVALVAASLAACNQGPTEPTQSSITETFEGTLQPGESTQFRFTVGERGTVSVIMMNSFQPDTSLQVGLGMAVGSWDGATCTLLVKNDNSVLGTVIAGSALEGEYCLSIYDSGNIGEFSVTYTVEVRHF